MLLEGVKQSNLPEMLWESVPSLLVVGVQAVGSKSSFSTFDYLKEKE
jgi:hypothetical protein